MITKVRIAPVERWCKPALEELSRRPQSINLVGLEVEIYTEAMVRWHHDGMKEKAHGWRLTKESWEKIGDIIGHNYRGDANAPLCEHMLEMD